MAVRNSKIIPAFLFMVMFFAGSLANAQDSLSKHTKDTLRLGQAFQKGKMSGQFRYFFMATDNRDSLSDYYAHAAGARLKYETAPFRKFQVGIAGGFVYNLSSSDLAKPDPTTHQYNRYEIGLFDVEDPANKKDIDRVEELYLKYKNEKLLLSFGKQIINTPFINPQDGRMQPTAVEGLYGQWQPAPALKIDGGWLYAMSPRSTGLWFSIGETMGLYPQGLNPDGSKSNYASNISSAGIGLLGLEYKPINQLQLKAWNVFTENVSNTMLLEAAWQQP